VTTGHHARDQDAISHGSFSNVGANFENGADHFVTGLDSRRRQHAVVEVEVGAADCCCLNFDYGAVWPRKDRIIDGYYFDGFFGGEDDCSHLTISFSVGP
jgi:hypothetical protein